MIRKRNEAAAVVHVRWNGVSQDLPLAELDLGAGASDEAVRAAVARRLNIAPRRLDGHVVERHPTGNLTVRPETVFG